MNGHVAKAIVVALVALLAIVALRPPAPLEADAPLQVFSARRAAQHLEQIANRPHPMGSDEHARVRRYVVDAFRALGLQVEVQDTEVAVRSVGRILAGRVQNIIARYRGGSTGPAIMVAAHYDSVAHSPAASDDGAGTASLIEMARALRAGPTLGRDVIFLVSDGEEHALGGALAFVREHAWAREVGVVLNLEARGVGGTVTMFDTTPEAGALIAALAAVPRPSGNSLVTALAELLPNDTDLTAFQSAGLAGMAFAYAQGVEHYHRPSDDRAHLELASVQDHGDTVLALVRELAVAALPLPKRATPVYFDLARQVLVHYSHGVARLLAALSLVMFVLAARTVARRQLATTVGRTLLAIVAAVLVSSVLHAVQLYDVSFPQAARAGPWLVLAALGSVYLVMRAVVGRHFDSVAGLGVFALLTLVTALWAPGASFVFQWPLLIGCVAQLLRRDVAAASAALLLAPLGFATWVAAGPAMVAGPVLCGALLLCLMPELLTAHRARLRPVAIATLLALIAGQVTTRVLAPQVEYAQLRFAIDMDNTRAAWLATTAAALPGASKQAAPEFSLQPQVWVLPATTIPKHEPALVSQRSLEGSIELSVTPRGAARCFELWHESGPPLRVQQIQQREILQLVRFSPERDAQLFRLATGDRSRITTRLEYCGLRRDTSVTLRVTAAPDTVLRLIEKLDGLPEPRRQHAPDFGSDVTLLSQRIAMTGA